VPEAFRGAGLAGRRPAEGGGGSGSGAHDAGERIGDAIGDGRRQRARAVAWLAGERGATGGGDACERARRMADASRGERSEGVGHLERRDALRAERDRAHGLEPGLDTHPCATSTTRAGPTRITTLGEDRVDRARGRLQQRHRAVRLVGDVVHHPGAARVHAAPVGDRE